MDDLSSLLHACTFTTINTPVLVYGISLDHIQTLCIRVDLGTVESSLKVVNELILADGNSNEGHTKILEGKRYLSPFILKGADAVRIEKD